MVTSGEVGNSSDRLASMLPAPASSTTLNWIGNTPVRCAAPAAEYRTDRSACSYCVTLALPASDSTPLLESNVPEMPFCVTNSSTSTPRCVVDDLDRRAAQH
jgi:hypothetical protein